MDLPAREVAAISATVSSFPVDINAKQTQSNQSKNFLRSPCELSVFSAIVASKLRSLLIDH